MLSGVVDFAVERVVAGWAKSPHVADLSVAAFVDDAWIAGACIRHPQQADVITFRITLPRTVSANELVAKTVVVEARTAIESLRLDLWRPIVLAAEIDRMDSNMLERLLRSLSQERCGELSQMLLRHSPISATQNAGVDSSAYDDLMRWS